MEKDNLIIKLKERGLVAQITNEKALVEKVKREKIILYCGFDPTADSLHVGHLIPLLCLKHFQKAGHKPIVLLGNATGLIGDPSFKTKERKFHTIKTIENWMDKIQKQVALFLNFRHSENAAICINNYDWLGHINILTFLRDIGKYFSINQMINKDAIKQRLYRNSQGMSFTEFSYNLLQSYDFAYLNRLYNVILQIGGSDQWGNIVSGIDLTRRLYQNQVYGLTVPLFTKVDGTKFGKTESNTIWLDPKKTSPYKFYQFWINISDVDVYRYLKFFTFIDIEEINKLEKENKSKKIIPHRTHQSILAEKVTYLVHGEKGLKAAKNVTFNLFKYKKNELKEVDWENLVKDGIPTVRMNKGENLAQALVKSGLQPSKNQAHKTIVSNAVTVNRVKCQNPEYIFTECDLLFGRYTLLCHGKKNYCLLLWK